MRPLELRLRDFRSYRGEGHVFDFRDRRLVGIVGPIGSGKSSLLDAMAFALYGRTPAVGRNVKALIHQRSGDGGVSLRFEVDGQVWEVARVLRRTGQSQHLLTLLDEDREDAEALEKITMAEEVNEKIADLLGLDFDAFTRSVLLAQGRFAEFLSARPAQRDAVLKGVFGHDRLGVMRELARARAAEAQGALAVVTGRLDRIDTVMADLADRKVTFSEMTARLEALEKAEPRLADLDGRIADATKRLEDTTAALATIDRLKARVPKRPDVERVVNEGTAAAQRRARLAKDLDAAQAAAQAAERDAAGEADLRTTIEQASRLATLTPGLQDALRKAQGRQEQMAKLEATRADEVQKAAARVDVTASKLEAATEEQGAADTALESARAALDEGRHADMAAALRTSLEQGSACPVCDQDVHELPPVRSAVDLAALEAELARARTTRSAAEKALRAADADAKAARHELETARRDAAAAAESHAAESAAVTEAESALADHQRELADMLGSDDGESALTEMRKSLAALTERRDEARRQVDIVRRKHDEAITAEQAVARALAELHTAITAVATTLSLELPATDGSPETLAGAYDELEAAWKDHLDETGKVRQTATGELETARSERADLLDELGVTDFEAERTRASTTLELLTQQIERDEAVISAAGTDIAERDRLTIDVERYQQIASDLTDSKFVRYLLDEERTRLADLGSDHFQHLTSGRYRFSGEDFDVLDLAAAEGRRKSDSLSGGETFLASLALALGLAEMVSRSGGRLDAFFIDEGFGSLDPEHLALAMDGIERLITDDGDRLVVVVSHVPEMRERVEDLIVLDKDATTGDTLVRRA